jgi:hypothetical protein
MSYLKVCANYAPGDFFYQSFIYVLWEDNLGRDKAIPDGIHSVS